VTHDSLTPSAESLCGDTSPKLSALQMSGVKPDTGYTVIPANR